MQRGGGRALPPHEGAGVGGAVAKSSGAFFFVWTLLALGVTGTFSVILSARGLWSLRSGQRREAP